MFHVMSLNVVGGGGDAASPAPFTAATCSDSPEVPPPDVCGDWAPVGALPDARSMAAKPALLTTDPLLEPALDKDTASAADLLLEVEADLSSASEWRRFAPGEPALINKK